MNKEEHEKYLKSLPPNVREDARVGGKTQSPVSDAAMLLMIAGAVKAAPVAAKKALIPMLRHEWKNRTLSRGAWEDWQQFGIEPKGIQGWRPFKAFTPKMLKTGPTSGAENVMKLLINKKKQDK